MANSGRPSVNKRNREQARRERAADKAQRRDQRDAARKNAKPSEDGEDPDLAGIVAGPQPPQE